ncbi:hypothetical protein [Nocardioides bigeumensis]|jgi:hypothetical protein|uniref:Secreted protein n=1 Tax=Nocardioides bigeumensis TaxID=433657 RepID=A0ABN2YFR9_9ACTN
MTSRYAAALAASLLLALAGCSGDDEPTADPTPSDSSTEALRGEELPAGFPTEEVPLVGGEVTKVLENEGLGSYLIEVKPDTSFQVAFSDATAQLTGAGFEMGKDVISAGPDSSTADFTSDDWFVVVTGSVPAPLMQYTVYPSDAQ